MELVKISEKIREVFLKNGIEVQEGHEDEILHLDSLSFLSILVDVEDALGIGLDDNESLFELGANDLTFNKLLMYAKKSEYPHL